MREETGRRQTAGVAGGEVQRRGEQGEKCAINARDSRRGETAVLGQVLP